MEVKCPYCQHAIKIKSAKPGTYRPQCPKCSKRLLLSVPAAPGEEPTVRPLPDQREEAAAETPGTVAEAPPSPSAPSDDIQATGEWSQTPTRAQMTAAGQGGGTVSGASEGTLPDRSFEVAKSAGDGALPPDVPATLGGYRILKELGRGAMGAVYLARQMSLDRDVALKVIQSRLASNPTFIARFTREAYAAAQLVHPNVVQIYDLGCEAETYFFSMEFVEGESLASLVQRTGKLDAETAVRHIVQAARGLKFAHDQGMVHRDVKPDNLLLSKFGIVKLADLGLVKSVGVTEEDVPPPEGSRDSLIALRSNITLANSAMGTPAYMAPEQAEDASRVDHRADIYSLGCTLYVLLTGRPPFEGATAWDVITKHKTEPIQRPEVRVKGIPPGLSEITMKMVAKKPADRYADLSQAIDDMEKFLGIQGKGPFLPQEENLATLEQCAARFYQSLTAKLRGTLVLAFLAICAVTFLGGLLFGSLLVAGGALALGLMTPSAYFVISGAKERTYLFLKVRELMLGSGWGDWLRWVLGILLAVGGLYLFGQLWIWLGMALIAAGVAAGLYFSMDRKIGAERSGPLAEMESMLKLLRLRGLGENAVREFVATYSGSRWEEFFEALFGYEAKLAARIQWAAADEQRRRDRFRGWRDGIIRWIDARLLARRAEKDRKHLQRVEVQQLKAQGLSASEARQRAEHAADNLVHQAAEIRKAADAVAPPSARTAETPDQRRARVRAMLEAAHTDAPRGGSSKALGAMLDMAFGSRTRFVAGAVLLVGFFFWLQQNSLIPQGGERALEEVAKIWSTRKPLELPLVPSALTGLTGGLELGIAGLLLVLTSFASGLRAAAFALPAAAIALFSLAPGVPGLGSLADSQATSAAAGAVLTVLCFLFAKKAD